MSTSRKITGSQLIAKSLKMEGVENIFTLAGDHVLPALDVMSDERFRLHGTRHEQAATHMADAWGRLTGILGGLPTRLPALLIQYPDLPTPYIQKVLCYPLTVVQMEEPHAPTDINHDDNFR